MASERTIAFDPAVLEEAERRADAAGSTLSAWVNEVVARQLGAAAPPADAAALEDLRAAYLEALLERDARRAREVVDAAVAGGVGVLDLYTEVFRPALYEVGHLWAVESINVAQEHFATSVTQALLSAVAPASRVAPTQGRLAVVTNTPGEQHLLGAQMVADLLERDGWEVLALGADTPAHDLVELVEMECPDIVALSTSTAGRLPGVAQVLERLGGLEPRPFVAVGGALFTDAGGAVATELGADLVGSDVRAFITEMRERFPPVDAPARRA